MGIIISYHHLMWQPLPNHEFDKAEVTYLLPESFLSWLPFFSEMPYFLALNNKEMGHIFGKKLY